ncbi:ArsC/Spx/MgsR family protein [Lactococcus petauri]|uniref:ArsC/Spx/MgsR family protein n=1 Tax=Lactococcus petauri TaxID=1940789 RepID=UPI0018AC80EA|nr:ArsC/Spx/MgsR family protein [Lactococcus petauri]MDC0826704.1 hypothetical protein [Lactococcus petauri]
MITLYYGVSSAPSRKAIKWFEKHDIECCKKRIDRICKEDLIRFLALSKNGFSDLLKNPNRTKQLYLKQMKCIEEMSFNTSIDFIIKHPHLLRVPLILSGEKISIGYNGEEIRVFLSKKYRNLELY